MNSGVLLPAKDLYAGLYDGPHATPKTSDSGPIFLGIRNVTDDGRFDFTDIRHISEDEYPRWIKRVKPSAGDIVFTYEATLNRYALIPEGFEGCLGRRMALIRPNESKAHNRYLYYYFFSPEWRNTIQKNTLNGSTVDRIPLTKFPNFPIRVYDLETQKWIAKILGTYDDLIENNSKRIEVLESMAHLLYRHHFEIPAVSDWESLPLNEILFVHRGKSYKSSELSDSDGLPFVNLKCINRGGGFRKDGIKGFTGTYKPTQQVYKGDIVMAVTDMTQERMIVARPARVPSLNNEYGVISMDLVKIEPKDGIELDYIYSLLRWSEFSGEVKNHANGANVLHLLPARITAYRTPIAPAELQRVFAKKVRPIFNLIDTLQLKNENLGKARDLLLPRLMSGEILN